MNISDCKKKIKLFLFISLILCLVVLLLGFSSTISTTYFLALLIILCIGLLVSTGILFFKLYSYIVRLKEKEQQALNDLDRLKTSQISKDQNIQELSALNYAMDQTVLYARTTAQGLIINLGERFAKTLTIDQNYTRKNLADLMNLSEVQKNRLLQLIAQNKGGVFNEEFELITNTKQNIWLDISILTIFKASGNSERLILCSDVSRRKEAQNEIERLNAARYKEKEDTQKSNASQIVEAQEEERKRIAKEIHDSIGQMLTALKFNIESINLKNLEKTTLKIEGLKQLSNDLIQGIRIATFNLTPPELKDYGISIALQKMAKELSKLTGKQILYENASNFDQRFDTLVETNLYRVTQEAVNNAIKYANSEYIIITINHSETILSITITDNGQGFDITKIPSKPKNNAEGGMGLFFMRERMQYINGRLFLNAIPGEGTKVTLNYNLQEN